MPFSSPVGLFQGSFQQCTTAMAPAISESSVYAHIENNIFFANKAFQFHVPPTQQDVWFSGFRA